MPQIRVPSDLQTLAVGRVSFTCPMCSATEMKRHFLSVGLTPLECISALIVKTLVLSVKVSSTYYNSIELHTCMIRHALVKLFHYTIYMYVPK